MGLAIFGALVIGWGDFNLGHSHLMGDAIALFSAFLYAIYLLMLERLRNNLNTVTILLWRCAFGALLLFPFVLSTKESLFPTSYQGWLILIALAIICQVIGQGLLVYSMKRFSSTFLAVFLLLEPILTAIFAWMILTSSFKDKKNKPVKGPVGTPKKPAKKPIPEPKPQDVRIFIIILLLS